MFTNDPKPQGPQETISSNVKLIFVFCLIFAVFFNYQGINRLPFDAHNFRQCQTLSTIETYSSEGVNVLLSKTNYTGEPGVLVLEFPLYQAISSLIYKATNGSHVIVRLFNIILTLLAVLAFYYFTTLVTSKNVALLTSGFILIAPLYLTYMSSYLVEPMAILLAFLCLISLFYCLQPGFCFNRNGIGWILLYCTSSILVCLIKVLYLFPCIVLGGFWFTQLLLEGGKPWKMTMLVVVATIPGLGAILIWQNHAEAANYASFGSAVGPAAHIGWSHLLDYHWYLEIGKRLVWRSAGLCGVLAGAGWIAYLARHPFAKKNGFIWAFTLSCVVGYHVMFANITMPHNYYSLIVLPFLCLASAQFIEDYAISELGTRYKVSPTLKLIFALSIATTSVVLFFLKSGFTQRENMVMLKNDIAHYFTPNSYAIAFVSEALSPGGGPLQQAPALLYALNLRGSGLIVKDSTQAKGIWAKEVGNYRHLKYLVFYGVTPPLGLPPIGSQVVFDDPKINFHAWQLP